MPGLPLEYGERAPLIPNASLTVVEIEGEKMRPVFVGEESCFEDLTEEVDVHLH